ncbi:hypothetical protein [Streptomyces sp. NPDC002644]
MSEQTVDRSTQPEQPEQPVAAEPVMPQQSAAAEVVPVTAGDGAPAGADAGAGDPDAVPEADRVKPRKDRRVLRAVARWTAAAVVFAAVGTGTAYGIASLDRTDVPGLATESDGRWDYPELVRPPLPEGSPAPFAEDNPAQAHHADLRELVLPAPRGATPVKALAGDENGWLKTRTFLAGFAEDEREELGQLLVDNGLRHIAARGWTMPDGTRTEIFLLHFTSNEQIDSGLWSELNPYGEPGFLPDGTEAWTNDEEFPLRAGLADVDSTVYLEDKPYGDEQMRQAYLMAGDVLAVINQSKEGTAPAIPFQQTVALQTQLLG